MAAAALLLLLGLSAAACGRDEPSGYRELVAGEVTRVPLPADTRCRLYWRTPVSSDGQSYDDLRIAVADPVGDVVDVDAPNPEEGFPRGDGMTYVTIGSFHSGPEGTYEVEIALLPKTMPAPGEPVIEDC